MKSLLFLTKVLQMYRNDGIIPGDPDYRWNDAHHPIPRCEGGTETLPLIENHHYVHDIYQSEDFGRCCFFVGNVRRFLYGEGFLCENWFDLVHLYEKWASNTKGRSVYTDPETGLNHLLFPEDALSLGFESIHKGKTCFRDPLSGETVYTSKDLADAVGLVHVKKGSSTYRNPDTGITSNMSPEDASRLGWDHINKGFATFRNPQTGECARLPVSVAQAQGLIHVTSGTTFKQKKVTCPHCGKTGGAGPMNRTHFQNCPQREGSWNWFTSEIRLISKTLIRQKRKQETVTCPYCGKVGSSMNGNMKRYHFDKCKTKEVNHE